MAEKPKDIGKVDPTTIGAGGRRASPGVAAQGYGAADVMKIIRGAYNKLYGDPNESGLSWRVTGNKVLTDSIPNSGQSGGPAVTYWHENGYFYASAERPYAPPMIKKFKTADGLMRWNPEEDRRFLSGSGDYKSGGQVAEGHKPMKRLDKRSRS